jgi:uncharacterized repeat protein (TIGR02543 family)
VSFAVVRNAAAPSLLLLACRGGIIFRAGASLLLLLATTISWAGIGMVYSSTLWPKVSGVYQVPYTVASTSGGISAINTAISRFNSAFPGIIQFVPRASQVDYVEFNLDPALKGNICSSMIGRLGGKQVIGGAPTCTRLLHEMGHTVGLYHEQTRPDRNNFLTLFPQNISKFRAYDFATAADNFQVLGFYDYAAQVEYPAFEFSTNGNPTLETIPPGIPLAYGDNTNGYSAGDIDSIRRMYGAAPKFVTVTANPQGLKVTVDGVAVTTPKTFSWALNSSHTLSVPAGAQTQAGAGYIFGNWNDRGSLSHSVVIKPGNGQRTSPATSPAVTVYMANFVQLIPYTQAVSPAGSGTLTVTPAPKSYAGLPGKYFVSRQAISIQASPASGFNFYGWSTSPSLGGAQGPNPDKILVPQTATAINITARFTTSPVVTINSKPVVPGVGIIVDGKFFNSPKNFALPFDSTWTAGSSHAVSAKSPQVPYVDSVQYRWLAWSDGGAQSHNISVPSGPATFTATLVPQWRLTFSALPACAGTITAAPNSVNHFYDVGTVVGMSQSTNSGWTFTGWTNDLTGTTSPQNLTINPDELVNASYNTAATPLAVSGFVPASTKAGAASFTLTVNGAGFTPSSVILVNHQARATTFVSATQLKVQILAADIAASGAFQVAVANSPSGAACAALAPRTFFVTQ